MPVGGPTARLARARFPNAAVSRTRQRGASNDRWRPPATTKFAEFRGVIGAVVVVVDVRIRHQETTRCRQTSPEMSRIKDVSRRTTASGLAMKDPAESNADNQLNGLFDGRGECVSANTVTPLFSSTLCDDNRPRPRLAGAIVCCFPLKFHTNPNDPLFDRVTSVSLGCILRRAAAGPSCFSPSAAGSAAAVHSSADRLVMVADKRADNYRLRSSVNFPVLFSPFDCG